MSGPAFKPPVPRDEARRQKAVIETGVLDTPPEPAFDAIVEVARELCGTSMAVVSLIDADRQWFKAKVGLKGSETPRDEAFCAHAICEEAPLIVEDATRDARFADNPSVIGDPNIRFYAGVPLRLADGAAVGMLCVFDSRPRSLSAAQLSSLRALARQVASELQLRRQLGATSPSMTANAHDSSALRSGRIISGKYRSASCSTSA